MILTSLLHRTCMYRAGSLKRSLIQPNVLPNRSFLQGAGPEGPDDL